MIVYSSYLTGDIKFISTVLGHQGGKSTYPCFLCTGKDYLKIGDPRTIDEWINQIENIKTELVNVKSRKSINIDNEKDLGLQLLDYTNKYGKIFIKNYNVFSIPSLDIKLENVVIPPLHVISGILNKLRKESEKVNETEYVKFEYFFR